MTTARPKVYVAGPMKGLSYVEADAWREAVKNALPECHVFNPLRGDDSLRKLETIPGAIGDKVSSQHAIYIRDQWDVRTADAVFVYLQTSTSSIDQVSIGTCFELAWATAYQVPAVVVLADESVHDHPFVREAAWVIAHSLGEGIFMMRSLLNLDRR